MTIRLPMNHNIATVVSTAGVSHAVQGGTLIELLHVDSHGRTEVPSVCGKVIKGDVGAVEEDLHIRCRPCKKLIAKGRPIVPVRKG